MKALTMVTKQVDQNPFSERTLVGEIGEHAYNDDVSVSLSASGGFPEFPQKRLYSLVQIRVPDWISAQFIVENAERIKYFLSYGGNLEWGQKAITKIFRLEGRQFWMAVRLMKMNVRAEFKVSLKNQLKRWIDGTNKYQYPFTEKQVAAYFNTWEIKNYEKTKLATQQTSTLGILGAKSV